MTSKLMKGTSALGGVSLGFGITFLIVAAVALLLAIGGFSTMLGFGVLHSQFAVVPAIGFAKAFMTNIGIWLVFGTQIGGRFGSGSSK